MFIDSRCYATKCSGMRIGWQPSHGAPLLVLPPVPYLNQLAIYYGMLKIVIMLSIDNYMNLINVRELLKPSLHMLC